MDLRVITGLILCVVACLALSVFAAPQATVFIDVGEGGNATVRLVIWDNTSGSISVYLPRFEKWSYTFSGGNATIIAIQNTSAYFYNNVTFAYTVTSAHGLILNISYNFPFAALYTSNKGWFMSPLLGASPLSSFSAVITISDLGALRAVTLNGAPVTYAYEGKTLRVPLPTTSAGGVRVTIDFNPDRPIEEVILSESIDGIRVNLQAPYFYRGLLSKIASTVRDATPMLREIFGYSPQNLDFKLFLPTMMDLSALGYVMGEDINAGGEGPVYLNLALVRFKEGYMETTIVHELVHKILGALGVPASRELRWFHEGVAQYVSLKVCKELGLDVNDTIESLEEAAKLFREGIVKPGFVSFWNPSGDEGRYYAASYYIVSSLAEERGGLAFIRRVAEEIRKRGGVRSNEELVEVLSAAAEEDLTPLFKNWGFQVEVTTYRIVTRLTSWWVLTVAAILVVAAVAFSLLIILARGRSARCPYCYAAIPRDAVYCPYCGYPLKHSEERQL
ncbi:MAG: zinc ribbon domain-containing protein [Thermofilaceae archaeon]